MHKTPIIFIFALFVVAVGCSPDARTYGDVEECTNGTDDDGDGAADCDDTDCCSQTHCFTSQVCTSQPDEQCYNEVDDDKDGHIDCDDPDCFEHVACTAQVEVCDNGEDDNGDGAVDCDDEQCALAAVCIEVCDNGVDDDGNFLVDCADPDCIEFLGCQEEICNNDEDDNGDGLADCLDPTCETSVYCATELCQNELDENRNGLFDCFDPDCFGTEWCGDCSPYDNSGCAQGETCYLDKLQGYVGRCDVSEGAQGLGESCAYPAQCAPGLYCTNAGANSVCMAICYPGLEDSCPTDAPCTAFYTEWGIFSAYGVCWPY